MLGGIIFMVGIVLIAVNFTYFTHEALLLAGIVLAGLGVTFSKLFREF